MFAWHGKILRVNLTTGSINSEDIDPNITKDYIGGRGWAAYYMLKEVDPGVDPYSAKNKLIMATGPLTGTPAPTGNRYMVVTKSPLTGGLANSNSGGYYPLEMKLTGYDMFIFEGCADKPVYLWVHDDKAELRSAEHLWGKNVPETEDLLLMETDSKARVACIGPAGEQLVRFAAIMNDKHRAAGRSGVGAVMGSKNLKAVVVRGSRWPTLAHPKEMDEVCLGLMKEVGDVMKAGALMRKYGTSYVPPITNELGILPVRNFQTGVFEGIDGIQPEVLRQKYLVRPKACWKCPIVCGRLTKVDDPKYKGEGEGPEYETIASLGSSCGINNFSVIAKANYICNELGMDTISMGLTISCAMEMVQKGFLSEDEIGMPLKFGDGDAVIEMVKLTGYRKNFGDQLAEGSYRLASKYGHPEFSMTAKQQEFPGYDPRGAKGMGLLYATSNKGASHMAGDLAYAEVFGTPAKIDPLTTEGKPYLIKKWQNAFAVLDSAGLCVFVSIRYLFQPQVDLVPSRLEKIMNLATGAEYTPDSLIEAGERIFNTERLFLTKAGFSRKDDTLPKRMLEEPLTEGGGKGNVCELDQMLPEYYNLRGWDQNGIPTDEKLKQLGIGRS
jgi:aldehyde:ferredoxin oxidoreductase